MICKIDVLDVKDSIGNYFKIKVLGINKGFQQDLSKED